MQRHFCKPFRRLSSSLRAPISRHTLNLGCSVIMGRFFSTSAQDLNGGGGSAANKMESIIREKLQASVVEIKDVSGGCGSFFQMKVVSPLFEGRSLVQQHRMVNELLKSDIQGMHGLTLITEAPSKSKHS